MLERIPKLSFAERQELIRHALAVDEDGLTAEESAVLDARMEDFRAHPEAGIPLEQLKEYVRERLARR